MKNKKAPGPSEIYVEMIQGIGDVGIAVFMEFCKRYKIEKKCQQPELQVAQLLF